MLLIGAPKALLLSRSSSRPSPCSVDLLSYGAIFSMYEASLLLEKRGPLSFSPSSSLRKMILRLPRSAE